jgi:hypothetical protein
VLLFVNIAICYAQDDDIELPCGGNGDPDITTTPCEVPLDTWVYILVIAAVIFGVYHLYKKQKPLLYK